MAHASELNTLSSRVKGLGFPFTTFSFMAAGIVLKAKRYTQSLLTMPNSTNLYIDIKDSLFHAAFFFHWNNNYTIKFFKKT